MALGKASKLVIFVIILNVVVSFAGAEGIGLSDDVDIKKAEDFLTSQEEQTQDVQEEVGGQNQSGILNLNFFDPVSRVWDGIVWIIGFFINPPLMAGALPAPLGSIMMYVFAGLEVTAIVSVIRGVAA